MKEIRKAFKYRLIVTPELTQKMVNYAGASRFVWNTALRMNLYRLNNKLPLMWYDELDYWTKLWKRTEERAFLNEIPSQVIQQKLKDLERAFKDAFDKTQPLKRLPVFKKKGLNDSFRYPQGFKIDQANNRVFLPKLGWVRYRNSRPITGTPKNITVTRKGAHWTIAIQTEQEVEEAIHPSTSIIGLDLGVKQFATLSDGTVYQPLNSFKQKADKLANLQRKLKNKKKFSKNWRKAKAKITKCHEDVANVRRDYLQKLSTNISKNHTIIVVEDLKIKNMTKSATGTAEKKGKQVAQKSGLNKAILDQGWGMFVTMLEYKQGWRNGSVIKVAPHYTSQTCPCCHSVDKENRLTQASFVCVKCGFSENADIVGAKNILTKGRALLAGK